MTLGNIKTVVRQLLQDDEYDGDVITSAANWFIYEILSNNRTRLMEDSEELTASQGDTTVDFPANAMAWIDIYTTIPQVYGMSKNFTEYADFMSSFANFASAAQGQAGSWTQYGNAMRFSHPLNADHTFQIDFIREPLKMVRDSDPCELPDRYEELVARGAKARILEIEEDYEYGQQERDILDPLVTAFIKNESRGGGKTRPTVIRTGRGRSNHGGVRRLGE
jgi:hypothetical protein